MNLNQLPENIVDAATSGDVDSIQTLLTKKADINKRHEHGQTALFAASYAGHLHCVNILLANKADVNIDHHLCGTPLMQAASNNHVKCIQALLDAKADINRAWSSMRVLPIEAAAVNRQVQSVKILLKNGADIKLASRMLCRVVRAGDYGLHCLKILLENGADPNQQSNEYDYPIYLAIQRGSFRFIKMLLAYKANVNQIKNENTTPLSHALKIDCPLVTKQNMTKCVVTLLLNGGDIHQTVSTSIGHHHIMPHVLNLSCSQILKHLANRKYGLLYRVISPFKKSLTKLNMLLENMLNKSTPLDRHSISFIKDYVSVKDIILLRSCARFMSLDPIKLPRMCSDETQDIDHSSDRRYLATL